MNDTITSVPGLRFHKFIWYIWMPCSFLVALFNAYSAISGFDASYSPVQHGGLLLVIYLVLCLVEILFVAAPAAVFVGFFRSASYAWYILMFESVTNIFFSPLLLIMKFSSYEGTEIFGKLLGIALDVVIVRYYWKRRQLFHVHLGKSQAPSAQIVPSSDPDRKYCRSCGNPLPAGSKFCQYCGEKL